MKVVSFNNEKQLLVLKEKNKNKKYYTTEIFSQDGYIFLLCQRYFLNTFIPRRTYNIHYKVMLRKYLNKYIRDVVNGYSFELEELTGLLCYNVETNKIYDNREILDYFRIVNKLTNG